MLSVFDILELMPRTDCGKCTYSSCMNTAKKLAEGAATMGECCVMAKDPQSYRELAELLEEEK